MEWHRNYSEITATGERDGKIAMIANACDKRKFVYDLRDLCG
jgi:hypothetical protein